MAGRWSLRGRSRGLRSAGRWRLGHHGNAKPSMGSERAVEVDQIGTWRWNKGCEEAQEFQGSQDEMSGAVGSRVLEAIGQSSVVTSLKPLEGKWSPSAVAAEQFKATAIVSVDVGVGVEGKTVERGTTSLARRRTFIVWEGKAALEGSSLE